MRCDYVVIAEDGKATTSLGQEEIARISRLASRGSWCGFFPEVRDARLGK